MPAAMDMIQESVRLFGPEFAKADAQELYNSEAKAIVKVNTPLTTTEIASMKRRTGLDVLSTQRARRGNDHVLVQVENEITDSRLVSNFPADADFTTVLHIGATTKEVSAYWGHKGHEFYLHLGEDKDWSRILHDLINRLGQRLKHAQSPHLQNSKERDYRLKVSGVDELVTFLEHMSGDQKRVHLKFPEGRKYTHLIFGDSLYSISEEEFLSYFSRTGAIGAYGKVLYPDSFITEQISPSDVYRLHFTVLPIELVAFWDQVWPGCLAFTTLIPIDGVETILKHSLNFLVEHGQQAVTDWLVGAMATPLPVVTFLANIFDVVKFKPVLDQLWTYVKEKFKKKFLHVRLSWIGGFSNGYSHHWWSWAKWLRKRRIHSDKICIDWEVVSRVGETYLMKFYRSTGKDEIVYPLELPAERRCVKLPRIMSAYNPVLKDFSNCPSYFYVLEHDWFKVLNWALGEPLETLDPSVVMTTVTRVRGGLSLNSNVLVAPMGLVDRDVQDFVMCILMESYRQKNLMDAMNDDKESLTQYEMNILRVAKLLAKGVAIFSTGGLVIPAYYLFRWLVTTNYEFAFVEYFSEPKARVEVKKKLLVSRPGDIPIELRLPTEKKKAPTGCVMCDLQQAGAFAKGRDMSSTQEFICQLENRKQDLSLTTHEMNLLITKIRDSETYHRSKAGKKFMDGLQSFKHWAETNAGSGVTFSPVVHYIQGGPGTGKSVIVREMSAFLTDSGVNNSIVFPFSDLSQDYMNAPMLNTSKPRTFEADTTWWLTLRSNVKVLFADEFTALDELVLRGLAAHAGVGEIYLVGDKNQTRLDAAAGEGTDPSQAGASVGGCWNWDEISTHTLVWNFRNPPWQVKAMNRAHGLKMKSRRTDFSAVPSIVVLDEYNKFHQNDIEKEMVFAHASGNVIFGKHSTPDKTLPGSVNMSVRSAQGKTAGRVACSASQIDARTIDVHGQMLVAFSRNRTSLVYVAADAKDDPVPSKIAAFYGFDSQENIDAIERLPWPAIETNKKEAKFSDETLALGSWLAQKKILGELRQDIPEGQEGKEEVEVKVLEPTKPFSIKLLATSLDSDKLVDRERLEMVEGALVYYKTHYHFCLLDSLISQVSSVSHATDIKERFVRALAKREKTAFKFCTGDSPLDVPVWKTLDKKSLIPIADFVSWFESEDYGVVLYTRNEILATKSAGPYSLTDPVPTYVIAVDKEHATPTRIDAVPHVPVRFIGSPIPQLVLWYVNVGAKRACELQRNKDGVAVQVADKFAGYIPGKLVRCTAPSSGNSFWDSVREAHASRSSVFKVVDMPFPEKLDASPKTKYRGGTDAYRLASFLDPSGAYLQETAINYAGMVRGVHRPGKSNDISVNWEGFIHSRTAGGKLKKKARKTYRSILPGMVNHFNDSPEETLNAAHRLGQRQKKAELSAETKAWATRAVKKVFDEHWYPNFKANEFEINAVVDKALSDSVTRNYVKRGMKEIEKRGYKPLLVMSNKDQVKPIKDGKLDLGKSGQGILQSPAYVAAEYCGWMRSLNHHFKSAARPHVFYENLMTAREFRISLTKALRELPISSRYGIVDGEEFDAQQNAVTLFIEKEFRRLQGAVSEVIDAYYEIRGPQAFTMFGCFRGKTNYEKGSGFLDTLLGNTTLEMVAGTLIFSGVGPKVVAAKGDDYMQAQAGLSVDVQSKAELQAYTGMRWKVSIGNGGEFCGNTVSRAGCFPSISRYAIKAIAAKSRNYKHFVDQQESYRQKAKEIREDGLEECIAANVLAENKTEGYVRLAYDVLNSIGHVSQDQWLSVAKLRQNPLVFLPSASGAVML